MICTHCNYEHGGKMDWDKQPADWVEIEGDCGDFWVHPIKMKRNVGADYYSNGDEEVSLYACPSCNKTFIED